MRRAEWGKGNSRYEERKKRKGNKVARGGEVTPSFE